VIAPTALPATLTGAAAESTPPKIKDAAKQFEAMLIAQMLSSARESGTSGWGGDSSDKSGDTMMEMAEQQLSKVLASGGGLGLATMITKGLSKAPANSSEKP
jgi:flagellar protein FlgJ